MSNHTRIPRQDGFFMIEALVSILLFAIAILGLVGMGARATAAQSDAQYRSLAASLASKIAQEAWLSVDRATGATLDARAASLAATLKKFDYDSSGSNCNFSGGNAASPVVQAWADAANDPTSPWYLPGAKPGMQQVIVDQTGTGYNRLTITVCWIAPSNPVARQHVLVTYVN